MKTSLKQNLQNYITSYKPREELRNFYKDDSASVDRQLRKLTEEGAIKRIFKGKYIIGYEPVIDSAKKSQEIAEFRAYWNKTVKPLYEVKKDKEELKRENNKQMNLL